MLTETQINEAKDSLILHSSFVHARNPILGSTENRCGRSQERRFLLPWPPAELDARRSDQVVG